MWRRGKGDDCGNKNGKGVEVRERGGVKWMRYVKGKGKNRQTLKLGPIPKHPNAPRKLLT